MAPSIPTREPESIAAGSTLLFDIAPGEYPTGDYALTYYLHPGASGAIITFTTTAVDGNHRASVAVGLTSAWAPGTYRYIAHAIGLAGTFEVRRGVIEILANPLTAATDYRSHAEKVLEALEALIEGKALRGDQTTFSIANRSITRMTPEEIRGWRDDYKSQVAEQRRQEDKQKGRTGRNKVITRFSN